MQTTYIQEIIVIDFVEFTCYNLQTNLQTLCTITHHRKMAEDNETKILGNKATNSFSVENLTNASSHKRFSCYQSIG